MYQDPDATPGDIAESKARLAAMLAKARMKRNRITASAKQALAAKAQLIIRGKGANGRSMSPELLDRHMNLR